MGNIFNKYILENSQAIAALEALKREVRELQGAEGSAQQKFQTNAQKRDAIYKEEGMSLKELRKQRDLLAQKSILSTDELQKLKGYNAQIDKAEANLKSLEKQKDKVGKTNKTLAGSFQQVGAAIGFAFGANEVLRFTKQIIDLAGRAQGLERAFGNVFQAGDLDKLRTAVSGTVGDLELMKQAIRADNFKIPLETLERGFEFARKRASQTGESVDYLVQSLIDGIGRKSTLVLDNLGISAAELQEEVRKVGDFSIAAGNIIERELGRMGDVALTAADRQAQLNAQLERLQIVLGEVLLPIFEDALAALSSIAGVLNENSEIVQGFVNSLINNLAPGLGLARDLFRDTKDEAREFTAKGIQHAISTMIPFAQSLEQQIALLKDYRKGLNDASIGGRLMAETVDEAIRKLEAYREASAPVESGLRTIASIQADIKDAQEKLNTEVGVGTAEYYKARAALDVLNQELERWTKETEKQLTLMEELEKMGGGLQPTDGMEEFAAFWRDFFSEFEDREMPFEFEKLEEMDQMLDDLSVEDKIEGITRSIERLKARGADPDLVADLEVNLDKLKDKSRETAEETDDFVMGLLERFVFSTEELMVASHEAAVSRLDELLEAGEITQAEYQAILDGMAGQLAAFRADQTASAIGAASQIIDAVRMVYSATAKDAAKNAGFLEALTTFQILLEGARAVASAIRAAAEGAKDPFSLVIGIISAVATVVASIARAKSMANQANRPAPPTFAYGGEIQGKPHTQGGVHIEAERGEYIVKSSAYAKAKEAVQAINAERFDTYVTKHYIEPLLKSKQLAREENDRGFARNIAESLHLDGKAEHYLKQIARKGNNARIENFDELARLMRKDNRGSTY